MAGTKNVVASKVLADRKRELLAHVKHCPVRLTIPMILLVSYSMSEATLAHKNREGDGVIVDKPVAV